MWPRCRTLGARCGCAAATGVSIVEGGKEKTELCYPQIHSSSGGGGRGKGRKRALQYEDSEARSAALHSLDVEDGFTLVHERDSVRLVDGEQPITDHHPEPPRVRPPNGTTTQSMRRRVAQEAR